MSEKPILILQMQRMGDLVLTFPLILLLRHTYPERPIWVVAERIFFEGLMPISPQVTFFPVDAAPKLAQEQFSLVINLSHRPEAAHLAGAARCEQRFGPAMERSGEYVHGNWALYRASLVHNNRHNLFHWADLNILDVLPVEALRNLHWSPLQPLGRDNARVGLFLGASNSLKHPSVDRWTGIAQAMLHRGLKPVLLGGKADLPLGNAVARAANIPALNLCGRFSLAEFVTMTSSLRCMVTPDTGPMHIAAWTGTPVLNLSLGNVHPWETGPYQPGHHVLRSNISCTGCWHCKHDRPLCHDTFKAERIASLTHSLVHHCSTADGKTASVRATGHSTMRPAGQRLFLSARDPYGLYDLVHADGTQDQSARHRLDSFWKAYFGAAFGLWDWNETEQAWHTMAHTSPQAVLLLRRALLGLSRSLLPALKGRTSSVTESGFWSAHPPIIRPLTGYLHLYLQNGEFSPRAFATALSLIERITSLSAE